ncbi:sensor histidine kinase [Buchananella hordeovulneris]|uniref:HAMP domain-containing sensor histidine kinase n=1 Tax=Buchananella hordeovulneris TaxID=52770 RepID=UPI000F5FAC49|nr:HAMP domain-containing sensor histidine kinase [Buchananella hordeovulneris]RRD50039.1 sensor histidine kinase [Buchananella hordeovulneris]
MRGLRWAVVALLAAVGAAIGLLWVSLSRSVPHQAVAFNSVVQEVTAAWPLTSPTPLVGLELPVAVVDADGQLIASTITELTAGESLPAAAARRHLLGAPVVVDGRQVGFLYADPATLAALRAAHQQLAWQLTGLLAALLVVGLGLAGWGWRRLVRPFRRLENFATEVAAGRLDTPLLREKDDAFGAWQQSFDLLRSELAAARARELAVQASKAELLAQLGHDLRTPLSTLSATAELLALQTTGPASRERLDLLVAKSHQVAALVDDIFAASATPESQLTVTPVALTSSQLAHLCTQATLEGTVVAPPPAALVLADPVRVSQVLQNLCENARKYAGHDPRIDFILDDDELRLLVSDTGPGVHDGELAAIFQRGYRGQNAANVPGHGLGLYTCSQLVGAMGGHITAANTPTGFALTVGLPLA